MPPRKLGIRLPITQPEPSSFDKLRRYLAMGVRGAGGLSPGGLVGAGVGAGSEYLAENIEGSDTDWRRIAGEAAVGSLPFGKIITAGRPFVSLAKGAALGGAAPFVRHYIAEGEAPSASEVAWGSVIGGATGGALAKLFKVGQVPTELPMETGAHSSFPPVGAAPKLLSAYQKGEKAAERGVTKLAKSKHYNVPGRTEVPIERFGGNTSGYVPDEIPSTATEPLDFFRSPAEIGQTQRLGPPEPYAPNISEAPSTPSPVTDLQDFLRGHFEPSPVDRYMPNVSGEMADRTAASPIEEYLSGHLTRESPVDSYTPNLSERPVSIDPNRPMRTAQVGSPVFAKPRKPGAAAEDVADLLTPPPSARFMGHDAQGRALYDIPTETGMTTVTGADELRGRGFAVPETPAPPPGISAATRPLPEGMKAALEAKGVDTTNITTLEQGQEALRTALGHKPTTLPPAIPAPPNTRPFRQLKRPLVTQVKIDKFREANQPEVVAEMERMGKEYDDLSGFMAGARESGAPREEIAQLTEQRRIVGMKMSELRDFLKGGKAYAPRSPIENKPIAEQLQASLAEATPAPQEPIEQFFDRVAATEAKPVSGLSPADLADTSNIASGGTPAPTREAPNPRLTERLTGAPAPEDLKAQLEAAQRENAALKSGAEPPAKPLKGKWTVTDLEGNVVDASAKSEKAARKIQDAYKKSGKDTVVEAPGAPEAPNILSLGTGAPNLVKKPGGGTTLGSGLGGAQDVAGIIQRNPQFALRLALGLGGAGLGAATDPLGDPTLSALAGGAAGFAAPSFLSKLGELGGMRVPEIGTPNSPSVPNLDVRGKINEAMRILPQYQRFNFLASLTGLPANALGGPIGSLMGAAVEKSLAGDPRGPRLLKELTNFREFPQQYMANLKDAALQEVGRAEGAPLSAATSQTEKVLGTPGRFMTAGDITARQILERAGFSPEEARAITLTSNPKTRLGKGIMALQQTAGPLGQLLLPFARTPVNVMEQGMERIPLAGFLTEDAGTPLRASLVKQGVGAGVGLGAEALAEQLPPEQARVVRRYVTNLSGQFSLPAAIGFAIGQARNAGRPEDVAILRTIQQSIPLPTPDVIGELGGDTKALKRRFLPAFVDELATEPTTPPFTFRK